MILLQVVAEKEEPNSKRSKTDEASGNEKAAAKAKIEPSGGSKATGDGAQKQTKDNSEPPEAPKDYIHVRARRGQATDSHSLAERVCSVQCCAVCFFVGLDFRFDCYIMFIFILWSGSKREN